MAQPESKMKQGLEAVYRCKVKNLRDDRYKVVNLRADVYRALKKEMSIEVISTVKPEGILWLHYQKEVQAGTMSVNMKVPVSSSGARPLQGKEKLPGEDAKAFRARRMLEGKNLKKWERAQDEAKAPVPVEALEVVEVEEDDALKTQLEDGAMEELIASQKL
jgi:hypothetical protein